MSNTAASNTVTASDAVLTSRLKVYAGIAELATKRYKFAARHFLGVSFDHCANYFQVSLRRCESVARHRSICAQKKPFPDCKTSMSLLGSRFPSNADTVRLPVQFSNIRASRGSTLHTHVNQHEAVSGTGTGCSRYSP